MNQYSSASLYVGDLNADVTESILFEIFNAVGPVASIRVCRDAVTRRSLGYAYVNFHNVSDAERALDTMNFSAIKGRPCRIMWSQRDPTLRKTGQGNIFVKNLDKSIDNKSLFDTFSIFGNILSCKVATAGDGKDSLGYGFVHFETEEAAIKAIEKVNGKNIADHKVIVQPFKPKAERGGNDKNKFTNVFVKNLPAEFNKDKLDELFGKYGIITNSMLKIDEESGKCKGFGFVNFETTEQAKAAIDALHDSPQGDKKLYVSRAQKKNEREKELRARFEQMKAERQKKFQNVNLYVRNLDDAIGDAELREAFAEFGNITSARVMKDANERTKGFGFVCFTTPEEATKAVTDMNGKMLQGKPLYVALAQRKEERRAQLEARFQAMARAHAGQLPMYPPNAGPMFFPGPMQQQRFMYPQQMMQQPRGWAPARGPQPMMGLPAGARQMVGGAGYVAPNGAVQQGRGPRGGRQGGARQGAPQGAPKGVAPQGAPQGAQAQRPRGPQGPQAGFQGKPQQAQQPRAAAAAAPAAASDTDIQALVNAPPEKQRQLIGEKLFVKIQQKQPELAPKITGMLLEMEPTDLLELLASDAALEEKITEAVRVLEEDGEEDGEEESA